MSKNTEQLLRPGRLYSGSEVGSRPCPVPASPGVYAFYFNEPPPGIDSKDCLRTHYYGNAAGSTLRRTLGCLLSAQLGIQLRRVESGGRDTFTDPGGQVLGGWIGQHAFVTLCLVNA